MDELGSTRSQAEFIVALAYGEVDGDIEFAHPVTPEERRRWDWTSRSVPESELRLDDDDGPS